MKKHHKVTKHGGKHHKHHHKKHQHGGNPIIPAVIGLVNEAAKQLKPATRLKGTRLGKVPVLGTILEGLSQMGYGVHDGNLYDGKPLGPWITAVDADMTMQKRRRLPLYHDQGLKGAIMRSAGNTWGQGIEAMHVMPAPLLTKY